MSRTIDLECVSLESLPYQAAVSENMSSKGRYLGSKTQDMLRQAADQENGKNIQQHTFKRFKGILFLLLGVFLYQGGSVVAKKLSLNPIVMIFFRDIITISFNLPFVIKSKQTPFPEGRRVLVIIRGLSVGVLLMSHFYAVRHLPMADVMMISSIKPVFITLLSCIFLKEDYGVLEIVNLVLVITGIGLVVQPSIIFGSTDQEYTSHMQYTATGLLIANAQGGVISVIIRYLKDMHWAPLAISTRIFGLVEMFGVCAAMGLFCIPECGFERWSILFLAAVGMLVQILVIFALRLEEAHVVGMVDSAASIVVAVVMQILFFSDYPNTLKIIGACLVLSSIFLIGGKKIWKKNG